MVAILGFSRERIFEAVKEMYTSVANAPEQPYHFPVGREAALIAGYPQDVIEAVPAATLASFAGVGYPFRAGVIKEGDTVLDIGAGAGTDAWIAARLVGPRGKVYALDMTPAMLARLRALAASVPNLEVLEGNAESLPLPDASVDVVTSNGMLNLVPDKRREIADIVIRRPVTFDCKTDPELWAECVVGAHIDEDYLAAFRNAGFEDVAVLRECDFFSHSRSDYTRGVARRFGAYAIEITMRRAPQAPPLWVQWARRADPRRAVRAVQRRGLAGAAALGAAMLACYGTLAATVLLSLAGITLAVNAGVVSAVILAFGVLAVIAVAAGVRKHGRYVPLAVALAGGAILLYAHLVKFSFAVEALGFVAIGIAIWLDHRAREPALPKRDKRVIGEGAAAS